MKILADYHTHTIYSHGKGTIEDNVKVAISKGIETLGISDHSYKHLTYGIKKDDIFKMREEIDILNEKYKISSVPLLKNFASLTYPDFVKESSNLSFVLILRLLSDVTNLNTSAVFWDISGKRVSFAFEKALSRI